MKLRIHGWLNSKSRLKRYLLSHMTATVAMLICMYLLFSMVVFPELRHQSEAQTLSVAAANARQLSDTFDAIRILKDNFVANSFFASWELSRDAASMREAVRLLNVYQNAIQDVLRIEFYPQAENSEAMYFFTNEGTGWYTASIRARVNELRSDAAYGDWSGRLTYDAAEKDLRLTFVLSNGGVLQCAFLLNRLERDLLGGMPNGSSVAIYAADTGEIVLTTDEGVGVLPGAYGLHRDGSMIRILWHSENDPYGLCYAYSERDAYAGFYRIRNSIFAFTVAISALSLCLAVVSAYRQYKPIRQLYWQINGVSKIAVDELEAIRMAAEQEKAIKLMRSALFQPLDAERREWLGDYISNLLMQPLSELQISVLLTETRDGERGGAMERVMLRVMDAPIFPLGLVGGRTLAALCFFDTERYLLDAAHTFQMECQKELDDCPNMAISNPHGALTELARAYMEAQMALEVCGNGETVFVDELDIDTETLRFENTELLEKRLLARIAEGDAGEAMNACRQILAQLFGRRLSMRILRFRCYGFLQRLFSALADQQIHCPYDQLAMLETSDFSRQQVLYVLEPLIAAACAARAAGSNPADSGVAARVQAYIEAHLLDEQLSLAVISDALHISVSYLGKQYKAQTGCTVMQTVQIKRMEWFKTQLRETSVSIQRLAEQCGGVNASSFVRRFRQQEGITPGAYRARFCSYAAAADSEATR